MGGLGTSHQQFKMLQVLSLICYTTAIPYTAQAFSQSSEELGGLRERHLTHFAVLPYEGNVMLNVPMPYLLLQHAHLAQSHIRSTTLTPAVVVVAVLVELIVADRKHSSD